jgi:hypothetical protein
MGSEPDVPQWRIDGEEPPPGGGWADGGHSSRNVPALLTDGEFVVKRKAVDSMGVGFFDKLNSGLFKKFHEGGLVGDEGLGSAALGSESSAGEMVNNITVNVNLSGETASTSVAGGSGVNDEKAKGLADMIQRQIVHTIINEKRSGGILS